VIRGARLRAQAGGGGKEGAMYIGVGTIVAILLLIVLIAFVF
jgi:hypothetical protein